MSEEVVNNESKEMVDHPSHYRPGVYEVINIAEYYDVDRYIFNVLKYTLRAGEKYDDTELEDLKKARWYLDRKIGRLEGTIKGPDEYTDPYENDLDVEFEARVRAEVDKRVEQYVKTLINPTPGPWVNPIPTFPNYPMVTPVVSPTIPNPIWQNPPYLVGTPYISVTPGQTTITANSSPFYSYNVTADLPNAPYF